MQPGTSPEWIAALVRKYRTLVAWRHERSMGLEPPDASAFRRLAREFPGALRELTVEPIETLTRRLSALETASGDPHRIEPWMLWMWDYHAETRTLLRSFASDRRADRSRESMRDHVVGRVARRHGVPSLVVLAALFPARERRR